ncbi:MAG: hypothetical protein ACTTJ1_00230 [Treponema sp.]
MSLFEINIFMHRQGSVCVPFRARKSTAAKLTKHSRKHSEVFQNSIFGLKDILTMKKDPRSCSMNMSVHASSLFKGKTLLNQMEEKF